MDRAGRDRLADGGHLRLLHPRHELRLILTRIDKGWPTRALGIGLFEPMTDPSEGSCGRHPRSSAIHLAGIEKLAKDVLDLAEVALSEQVGRRWRAHQQIVELVLHDL